MFNTESRSEMILITTWNLVFAIDLFDIDSSYWNMHRMYWVNLVSSDKFTWRDCTLYGTYRALVLLTGSKRMGLIGPLSNMSSLSLVGNQMRTVSRIPIWSYHNKFQSDSFWCQNRTLFGLVDKQANKQTTFGLDWINTSIKCTEFNTTNMG